MLQAAQLALAQPGSPPLVQQDTGGTPQGAAAAARAALGAGARILLGPLTAPEVQAAAPIAQQAQVPVLAFSNDPAVARPGVWPLGITPGEQVRRLVVAAQQAGKTQFAALLPDSAFGRAMGDALGTATTQAGMSPPRIQFHGPGMSSINQAARAVSDYEARWGPIEQQIKQARGEGTPEGARRAAQLGKSTPPPPPFDALLLGDVGEALVEVAAVLPYYFVFQPAVQFMGPSLWAEPASRASDLRGAWFAAPEPGARSAFVDTYSARYGAPPPFLADIAYDAAAIARVTAESGYSVQALTNPNGFSGADGLVVLLPSGEVRRGLALWQIQAGGAQVIQPAAPLGA
jgi:branched-chain amino acid transport system substrate-binding protein